jgi:CRISPR system Cascade subunit CasE
MSLYFSHITPAGGQVRAALHQRMDGPYADHQWLWRWFPAAAGSAREFVFRRHDVEGVPGFYVVSSRPPAERLGDWQANTRDYAPQLGVGERLLFELRANPTVRHARDGKSKRHDVVMEAKRQMLTARGLSRWADWEIRQDRNEHEGIARPALYDIVQERCSAWLASQGERRGFAISTESLRVEAYQPHAECKDRKLQFTTVDLSGELTVTDALACAAALGAGIGHAKAFGCGLLLVRRV